MLVVGIISITLLIVSLIVVILAIILENEFLSFLWVILLLLGAAGGVPSSAHFVTERYEERIQTKYPEVHKVIEHGKSEVFELIYEDKEGRTCFAKKATGDELLFKGCIK